VLEKVNQYIPARIRADVSHLPPAERAALDRLIEAARHLDPIFDRQACPGGPALRRQLTEDASPEGRARLSLFDLMRGPWDRQDHHRPFAVDFPRPPGAGFYPPDLGAEGFRAWVDAHPGDRASFEGLFTVIERGGGSDGGPESLVAVPYSRAYAAWLGPAAAGLREAADLTQNESLRRFLRSRAEAFETDDYYASDKDWMDLDSAVEVTIGPYETYEDELLGLKASFEAFVTVADPAASARLAKYKGLLPAMEDHLPLPDAMKTRRGAESPIRVVDLAFTSGEARKNVQTMAFNLPNDERVRAEKGAKKVLLHNIIEAKFDLLLRPIAERLIDPSQLRHLSSEAFFNETLFHELSHSLGPAFVEGGAVEVRLALGPTYSAIEEAKADVMGCYDVLYMIERGEMPPAMHDEILVSYFAGLFRSTRFGLAEAHGRGAALQLNRLLEDGAARFDPSDARFTVDLAKLEASITALVRDICVLQHAGDRAAAEGMLARYGVLSAPLGQALGKLGDLPIDLRPIYPLAGEEG
jgi:hypothetical protein